MDAFTMLHTYYNILFITNSFIRNFYWYSQMAKKLSVLNSRRLRNLQFLLSFSYYNFEDTVTDYDNDMFTKAVMITTCSQKSF